MSTVDSIRYMVKFMHCAFVAMEPQTGAVKAWVGDIDLTLGNMTRWKLTVSLALHSNCLYIQKR